MKELTYREDWCGGKFNFSTEEVLDKWIDIIDPNGGHHNAYITKAVKRFGSDYDHGVERPWENVDFIYEMPDDVFERNTKVLELFKRDFKIFLIGDELP